MQRGIDAAENAVLELLALTADSGDADTLDAALAWWKCGSGNERSRVRAEKRRCG